MKRLLTLLFWLIAAPAWGAIAVVNTPSALNTGSGGATMSMSFQCNATTDFLTVGISSYGTVVAAGGGTTTITGVTYNSVSMTNQTYSQRSGGSDSADDTHIFTLVAPTTGSSVSLVISYSPDVMFGGVVQPICWSGVHQTVPVGSKGSSDNQSASSPVADSISVTSGNYALDQWTTQNAMTLGVGQTSVYNTVWGGEQAAASYKQDAVGMSITFTGTSRVAHSWIEIKAAGGGGGGGGASSVAHRRIQ